VIGRIVDEANLKTGHIDEFHHPLNELTAAPTAFRTIVHVDEKPFDLEKILFSLLPPKHKPIHHEVTGFVAAGEKNGSDRPQKLTTLSRRPPAKVV
jgi:hypothetical protein